MKKERYTQLHHYPSHVYTWVHYMQVTYTYTCTFTKGKVRIPWKTKFLVRSIWSTVFWSMVLAQGIASEVSTLGILSKVLVLSGFVPWYWERHTNYKRRIRSLGQCVQLSNIWWSVRSSMQGLGLWCIWSRWMLVATHLSHLDPHNCLFQFFSFLNYSTVYYF